MGGRSASYMAAPAKKRVDTNAPKSSTVVLHEGCVIVIIDCSAMTGKA